MAAVRGGVIPVRNRLAASMAQLVCPRVSFEGSAEAARTGAGSNSPIQQGRSNGFLPLVILTFLVVAILCLSGTQTVSAEPKAISQAKS